MHTTYGPAKVTLSRHRTVADVMTAHVHVAGPKAPFKLLVRLIEENHIGGIPIVDHKGVPIGMVSEDDLLLTERSEEFVALQLMASPAITVPADTPLSEAAQMMQTKGLKLLVVVDPRGRIAGIVSRSNLVPAGVR